MGGLWRYPVYFTAAEREAVLEALASRLAGECSASEGVTQRRTTYENAEAAVANSIPTRSKK